MLAQLWRAQQETPGGALVAGETVEAGRRADERAAAPVDGARRWRICRDDVQRGRHRARRVLATRERCCARRFSAGRRTDCRGRLKGTRTSGNPRHPAGPERSHRPDLSAIARGHHRRTPRCQRAPAFDTRSRRAARRIEENDARCLRAADRGRLFAHARRRRDVRRRRAHAPAVGGAQASVRAGAGGGHLGRVAGRHVDSAATRPTRSTPSISRAASRTRRCFRGTSGAAASTTRCVRSSARAAVWGRIAIRAASRNCGSPSRAIWRSAARWCATGRTSS